MTDREKLIEMLAEPCRKHIHCCEDYCKRKREHCQSDFADHLLANGVTFAKDTDVPGKWISVEDVVPNEDCGAVLCFVSGRYKNITLQNCCEVGFYYENEGWVLETWPGWENPPVSHWMPLPKPPGKRGA